LFIFTPAKISGNFLYFIMQIIDPSQIPSQQLHRLLLGAIAPRPIAFASTIDKEGKPNLSPFSCFNVFGVNPTTLIFSPSRRGRDNTLKDTFLNIKEVPEAVINVVTYEMVQQASLASVEFPRGTNEFIKSGFTQIPSEKIRPFRVKESPFQIECKVRQVIETGTGGGSANLIICEVLLIHVNKNIFDDNGLIDPDKINLVGRMGGNNYVKASGNAIFKVPKPNDKMSLGIDALPEPVRMSKVLTGNELARLGSLENFPTAVEVGAIAKSDLVRQLQIRYATDYELLIQHAHLLARELIAKNEINEAMKLLLAV
jgi:flavin reductase (DIM6/NTAB) family NADH-FMN oxidoreductase RutF